MTIRYARRIRDTITIMLGESDIFKAAAILRGWGAREVMITHNTQVVVSCDEGTFSSPIRSRNFTGRTGRGDTCFAAYYTWRLIHSCEAAIQYAAALVSLKMETPGPFTGNLADVKNYIRAFY